MRALALHEDVVVAVSAIYATTCTLIRGSADEAFCVDSPILPEELDALPALAAQAGFRVVGCVVTHADWDHLLGPLAFEGAPIAVEPGTAERLKASPGEAQRRMRAWDDEHYVTRRRPLGLGAVQELPVPGALEVGDRELETIATGGHTADGMAIWVPWAKVLVCGDHLSPLEIPMLSPGGALDAYLGTLERLEPFAERADWVVPGHGEPVEGERALAILREDRAYLHALRERGEGAPLPLARRGPAQRRVHADNVTRV